MFHAIGKTVNAPSKVLLARSRSRQEDAEGFRSCSAWFWAIYIFLLFVTDGQGVTGLHGDADVCSAASLDPSTRAYRLRREVSPGGIRTGHRPQFESSASE